MQPSHPLGVGLSRGWGLIFQSRNFAQWGLLGYDKHDKHSLITIRLRVRPLYRGRKPVFCPSPRPRGVGQKMKINFQDSSPRAFQKCIGSLCLGHNFADFFWGGGTNRNSDHAIFHSNCVYIWSIRTKNHERGLRYGSTELSPLSGFLGVWNDLFHICVCR